MTATYADEDEDEAEEESGEKWVKYPEISTGTSVCPKKFKDRRVVLSPGNSRIIESKSDTLDLTSRALSDGGIEAPNEESGCHTVRYGYAVPIDVLPIAENPDFAEIVIDESTRVSRTEFRENDRQEGSSKHWESHSRKINNCQQVYYEHSHREVKCSSEIIVDRINDTCRSVAAVRDPKMAAMAKHEQLRGKFPTESTSGDEDIAAIAKQISDHAEAIYQTWKSRGLAPTEILNCHSNATAADKFDSALKPNSSVDVTMNNSSKKSSSSSSSPKVTSPTAVEIIEQSPGIDNNNLEKLVSNFVVEDRARLAAAGRQRSPTKNLPTSIQFALQKFERNLTTHSLAQPIVKPHVQAKSSAITSPTYPGKPLQMVKPQLSPKTPTTSSSHHKEIFLETIEATFPSDITPSKILVQQKRHGNTVISPQASSNTISSSINENSGTSPLTTWPLKTKTTESRKAAAASNYTDSTLDSPCKVDNNVIGARTSASGNYNAYLDDYLDEFAKEEERLINALKTGGVVSDDPTTPERNSVASSVPVPAVRQKPAIKKEKPKVDPVKQIIISHGSIGGNPATPTSALLVNNIVSSSQRGNNSANTSDTKILNQDDSSSMSDIAKVRYRAGQQNSQGHHQQRHDEPKSSACFNDPPGQLVSTTRTKFEPETVKDQNSGTAGADERDFVTSRWGPRVNSPRVRLDQVPHPELTTQQKQHIRAAAATGTGNNPIRPFLTRGSVAERVLIFEKCPSELLLDKRGPRQPAINTWRTGHDVQNKTQTYSRDKIQQKALPLHTTLQRHVKANRNVLIPRFYFPGGKPTPLSQVDATLLKITTAFQNLPGQRASRAQFHTITKSCDLPLYWKVPLFLAAGGDQNASIEMEAFLNFWKDVTSTHHNAANKFVRIVTRGLRSCIIPEDIIPLVQDVVETHPGLTFLKEATEFHSRYVHTVIARIFYCVNRSWSGKISVSELQRSNLLAVISVLEHEEDINQVTAYFSYEHFYVIYCKFWELDRDHDLFIDKMDLTRHNDYALSTRLIERIFSGAVTRGGIKTGGIQQPEDKMSYTEFVWFLLSEEDKNHPTAIEYWFRCMDLNGDGYLSMYELEYFYEEQLHRMEAIGMETLPFEDCLCQMLDMIHPKTPGKISLSDLKKCKMTSIFFDTFFNLEKYLDHEQRDPFASTRDHDADGHELSDWDRFAADEYELLVAEESGNDQSEQMMYENGFEDEETFFPNRKALAGDCNAKDPKKTDIENADFEDDSPTASNLSSKMSQNYDGGESDDYAESDN